MEMSEPDEAIERHGVIAAGDLEWPFCDPKADVRVSLIE
jgi:hypothetical protein